MASGFSALGAIMLPATGQEVSTVTVNAGTFAGALLFLIDAP